MGFGLNELEKDDLYRRAKPFLNKMYPFKELIDGKNVAVDYEFIECKHQFQPRETQKNDTPKPKKYTVWAILKSPKGKMEKVLLDKVVEYFENLHQTE